MSWLKLEGVDKYRFIEQKLFTAAISDAMDELQLPSRVMQTHIRPVHSLHTMVGRARTALFMDVYEASEAPYQVEIEAVDSLRPGDIVVQTTNGSKRITPWGNLMTTAAIARGARGAVIDGYVRDVHEIAKQNFPLFAAGIFPLDSKGRGYMVSYDCPIECGGVFVRPGDLLVADYDGVAVVPQAAEQDVLARALEKVEKENLTLLELRKGRFLREVYAQYGVL